MPNAPTADSVLVVGAVNPVENKVIEVPTHQSVNEKLNRASADAAAADDAEKAKLKEGADADATDIGPAPPLYDGDDGEKDEGRDGHVIVTGADAADYLLSTRDDGDAALTFRSVFLATILSGFQAVVYQIYVFKPTQATISGTFLVLIAYFAGNIWAALLPRGDKWEARWRERGGTGKAPRSIRFMKFINNGKWSLKEHAICAITANSASNSAASIQVFATQDLFYDLPLSATTVILAVISIGLFGYAICGFIRPITVWHVEAVYWSTLPTVKSLQGLHWQHIRDSKPIRFFWYAYGSMFAYEFFPAYIFPWLNSVSVPCLAAMHATGNKAAVLTNLFGGATNNEGLGWFSLSFDWQYITSFNTSLPLKLQLHTAVGYIVCFAAMLGIYYGNAWVALSQPFMSTRLRSQDGSAYPVDDVFSGGLLNQTAFDEVGAPRLAGSFAYAMFMANASIGALVAHCALFWGGDIVRAYKSARKGKYDDRHHAHMVEHYKEAPWYWYAVVLVVSFVLGLVVVIHENVTLTPWAYVVSLVVGSLIAPLSTLLYSRYGNGIATNNLSKMLGGLLLPERPVGNMYFAAWSHNIVSNTVALCNDLKLGEYLKIPPRVMFLTQIYGTILGGFVNYAVMISIVNSNRDLLVNSNGSSTWSGAVLQAYNSNAASWALAKYMYKAGALYAAVPLGLAIGAGCVVVHRVVVIWLPRIGTFSLYEINMPQFIQYAGYIPYNASQTCVILSQVIGGFFCQLYLRNYRPRIFRDYMYLVTAAWDGAALTVLFVLSFAVFGAGGPSVPFPTWWGNNSGGNLDLCPVPDS